MSERSFIELEPIKNDSNKLDPHAEKGRLQKLYELARADQQADYPDLYVSTRMTTVKAAGDLAKQLEEAKAEAVRSAGRDDGRVEALVGRLERMVEGRVEGAVDDVLRK
jgi:hypothetical protein